MKLLKGLAIILFAVPALAQSPATIRGERDDTATVTAAEGEQRPVRITEYRALQCSLFDSSGTETGTASRPFVTDLGSITLNSTFKARLFQDDVGLALESGGNLATLAGGITSSKYQTNIAQMNGVAVTMGNGASGTGVQRVTIANDSTGIVNQGGTWTVQPGNTANTTPWLVSLRPGTSGGWDVHHLSSAGSTNATVVKASAGQLGGWYIYNNTASLRKICFHNSASSPTAGASIYFCIPLPAGPTAANALGDAGIAFSSGIAYTTVTGIADSDTAAVSANDLNINLFYK